ncbi:MAG: protein kinase [Myxococcales bacterium]|nr:protein kinase [Myxococcales bacterium]
MNRGPRLPHTFGRYVLRSRVATGGMAEVFRATLPGFGGFEKEVAIKRMYRQYSDDATFVEMLTDEAKIVSQLHHPNIVQILDIGRVNEDYYIAFEFVDGVDLFRLLQKQFELSRDLPLAMSMHIVAELCSALDYAHARRTHGGDAMAIVHRDVSPQNVLVGHQGEVKLTDFGIAKAAYRFTQTQQGMIKGKLFYMSPEQARGEAIDHRSDLFAAGILLYELLCTRPLYGDGSPKELQKKVARGEYSWPADKRAKVPAALLAIVDKALQRNPDQRYQTGRALRAALLRVADQLGMRTDREALGAYVRKLYDVAEDRPPGVVAPRAAPSSIGEDGRPHWSTTVGLKPEAPDSSAPPRLPVRPQSQRQGGLPRPARRTGPAPQASVSAPPDSVPPPLPPSKPANAAPGAVADSEDDATAMLDMADLASRLANAAPPAPLHPGAASPPPMPGAASSANAGSGQPTTEPPPMPGAGAVPMPPRKRPPRPSLSRLPAAKPAASKAATGKAAQPTRPRPSSTHLAQATERPARQRRSTRRRTSALVTEPEVQADPSEASTRFVQAMSDEPSAQAPPPAQAAAAASTRGVPAMTTPARRPSPQPAPRRLRTSRPINKAAHAATRYAQASESSVQPVSSDPGEEPASWGLIGLTGAVWAGVIVLGVYSTLLLVR